MAKSTLFSYFKKVWCEDTSNTSSNTTPSVPTQPQLVTKEQLEQIGWKKLDDTFVSSLNDSLNKYSITDRSSIALFLATMTAESGGGKNTLEQGSDEYFAGKDTYGKNDRGAGYIQVTGRQAHLDFLATMGDSFKGEDTATYIAKNYPIEASAWYWATANKSGEGNL